MTKLKWQTDIPDSGFPFWAWVTKRMWTASHGYEYYTTYDLVYPERHDDIVAFMKIPHVVDDPSVWNLPYQGGEWPKKEGKYLCCYLPEYQTTRKDRDRFIRYLWFDAKTETFGGREMLAWMKEPKIWKGDKNGRP